MSKLRTIQVVLTAVLLSALFLVMLRATKVYVSDGDEMRKRRVAFSDVTNLDMALEAYCQLHPGLDAALNRVGNYSCLLWTAQAEQDGGKTSEVSIWESRVVDVAPMDGRHDYDAEEGLGVPVLHRLILDPWGNPYTYRVCEVPEGADDGVELRHVVYSWGANGSDDVGAVSDTGDDIGFWWRENEEKRHDLPWQESSTSGARNE